MSEIRTAGALYLRPTPAGAFHLTSAPGADPVRHFLNALLREPATPPFAEAGLPDLTGSDSIGDALELLRRMQGLGWIEGLVAPRRSPEGPLEAILPELLLPLSTTGKVLLADAQGFHLASQGFAHETAEELSALSADLASLHQRRAGLLNRNLGMHGSAWALVDAAGHSRIGFWPLHLGEQRFVLVLGGIPCLNRPAFVDLVWALGLRYAQVAVPPQQRIHQNQTGALDAV